MIEEKRPEPFPPAGALVFCRRRRHSPWWFGSQLHARWPANLSTDDL